MREEQKLVPFGRSRRRPDPAKVKEFAAIGRRLQEERGASADLVKRALAGTPRTEWKSLATRAELLSVGAVEQLGREIEARLDRDPREALLIAELATTIADALQPRGYPHVVLAQTRAHAWKDRGQSLCYLARHDEALAALDKADAMLDAAGTLAHDLAIVRFVKATTLQEINRFDDSMQLLSQCRDVFVGHGDGRRALLCGIARANLLHRLKRFREARDAYVALLDVARDLSDLASEAHLHHDIGFVSVELGEFEEAERHLDRAVGLCAQLKWPLQAARSEVVRGTLFARRGENRRAVAHIGAVRQTFRSHGLVEEAGLFGLEMVHSQIALGETHEAEALAREIVADFTAAGLNARAITALGYLTEAIAARRASTSTVGGVREYIVSLRKQPEREFVATA